MNNSLLFLKNIINSSTNIDDLLSKFANKKINYEKACIEIENRLNIDNSDAQGILDVVELDIKKHKELDDKAKEAQDAYYNSGQTIMSDKEYDNIFDEIKSIEDKYNYHPKWSVINSAGIEAKVEKGQKVIHEMPCLSQDKTKDRQVLENWLRNYEGILSWKNDGLTLVLTYDSGKLKLAASRGNGIEGQDITAFAQTQKCIPKSIKDTGHVVVRGEYIITYSEFNRINNSSEQQFSHPRNLASGNCSTLDMNLAKQRQGEFHLFEVAKCSDYDKLKTYENLLLWAKGQGFEIVEYKKVNKSSLQNEIVWFENKLKSLNYPTDGLVLRYNDKELEKLGFTGHAPRFSMAFKWSDELVDTVLRDIKWQPSKTGRITPVGVFDTVDLGGAMTSNATLNNISYIKNLKLGIGDHIKVFRANLVIPQIFESVEKSNSFPIPDKCPVCGHPTRIKKDTDKEFLMCDNPDCAAKQIKKLVTFASKPCMNIDGISERTIEAINDLGLLNTFSDFYELPNHKEELTTMEGFGEKAFDNLCKSIEKSKSIESYRLLMALSIPNVGGSTAKVLMKWFKNDFNALIKADEDEIMDVGNGIGMNIASSIVSYFSDNSNVEELNKLLTYIQLKNESTPQNSSNKLQGKSFCITGSLETLKNRDEFISLVEANGGEYIGSVKKGLTYLVTNDSHSGSSKNKKAQELGIQLITEQQFLDMIK